MVPPRPAGNVTAANLAFHNLDVKLANQVAAAMTTLRDLILVACGPIIRSQLSTEVGGIAEQSLPMIMKHLEAKYGTMTGDDLKQLRALLTKPFTTPANFVQEMSKFKLNLAALTAAGDNMSQTQLIEILTEATLTVVGFPTIIARYKRRVPIVLNWRLDDLSEVIEAEMEEITTRDANYANSATIMDETVANAASQLSISETLKLINARLDTMEATFHTNPGGGRGRGSGGAGRGRGDGRGPGRGGTAGRGRGTGTPVPGPPNYCFKHGTQRSHTGNDCYVMKRDPSYTQQMKDATAPCTIDGYEGEK
jgi:hypothetical protein